MLDWTASFASVVVAIAGVLIFWSNPARVVNRAVLTSSLHVAVWLGCLHFAVTLPEGQLWFRWTCAVGAFVPLHLWMVKESIATGLDVFSRKSLWGMWGWIAVSAALAAVCFTEFFVPSHSTAQRNVWGMGYYLFICAIVGLFGVVLHDAFKKGNALDGVRRLEVRVWLGGGGATAITILILMVVSALTHDRRFIHLQPLVILVFYAGTAYAIASSTPDLFSSSEYGSARWF